MVVVRRCPVLTRPGRARMPFCLPANGNPPKFCLSFYYRLTMRTKTPASDVTSLDDKALLALCRGAFRSWADNDRVVLVCVEELLRRGARDSQLEFAGIFIKARDEYDPGHRCHEGTVLDVLIDDLLPRFELDALIMILRNLDIDVLDGADGVAARMSDPIAPTRAGVRRPMARPLTSIAGP